MLDLVLASLFVLLPLVTFIVTRSMTWTAVGLIFGFGVAGNAVQSSMALGANWNVRSLQWLAVGVLVVVLVLGAVFGRSGRGMRRQWVVIVVPMVLIGAFLIAMRLLAPGGPGPLTAVGYFINHPLAEDNAKWLHLTSQLADGRDIVFNGYAGGPMLLMMSMMAALIAVLSTVMLGGVNEVAVAANTVLGLQFLLIALVPVAFAPLAERKIALDSRRVFVVAPLVWTGMIVLFLASSVITSYGHLSLQFVLIVLVLWALVFVLDWAGQARLLMTLAIATTASVWLPFNILGLVLLVGTLVWVLRSRNWRGLLAWAVTVVVVWDALISSTLYLFGIDLGADTAGGGELAGEVVTGGGVEALPEQVATASSLFTAPGGVEQIGPILALLAVAALLFVVWLMSAALRTGSWVSAVPFVPVIALGAYLLAIQVGDAITTGAAPHYGGHKLGFALTVMVLAAMLPIALAGLGGSIGSMSLLRWMSIGAVLVLLTLDTTLPRAISALSPMLWPKVDTAAPQYWSAAEVRDAASQPISSLPVACLFAPPETAVPTALPFGQESYACTRLLVGLSGLEGQVGSLPSWLQTDWLSNRQNWDDFYGSLVDSTAGIRGRTVVLMDTDGQVAGLATWGSLLDRNAPRPS